MRKTTELAWTVAALLVGGYIGYNQGYADGTTFGRALTLPLSPVVPTAPPTMRGIGYHPILGV